MTKNSINNQTILHVKDLIIIEPGFNDAIIIEDNNSNNENLLNALASMDVLFPDRKTSTTNYKQFNDTTQTNFIEQTL